MKQVIVLLVVAAAALGVWRFWPQITGALNDGQGNGNGENTASNGSGDSSDSQPPARKAKTPKTVTPDPVDPGGKPANKLDSDPPKQAPTETELEVKFTLAMFSSATGLGFRGTTNLPVGSSLRFAFTALGKPQNSDTPIVAVVNPDGTFQSGAIPEVPRVTQVVRVSFYPSFQTDKVLRAIGLRGARLGGRFARQEGDQTVVRVFAKIVSRRIPRAGKVAKLTIVPSPDSLR